MDDLEFLMGEWQKDSKIDPTQLDTESMRQANLHSKWLDLMTKYKIKCFKLEKDMLRIREVLTRYYNGRLTKDELKEIDRDQYSFKTPLKSELEKLIESDEAMVDISQKIYYYGALQEYCTEVLRGIRDRGFSLKTAVEWQRFAAGN